MSNKKKPTVIVICGPTASGKTALSIELAKKINGEIVSADSMQIYKEMNIGSAKIKQEEMCNIQHYLIDVVYPNERYSVANFKSDAKKALQEIINKGKTPIVVGGTGLYIDSLIYEIDFKETKIDEEYRRKLQEIKDKYGIEVLYNMAMEIDSKAMEKISINDYKRITRILEIYHSTGKTKTQQENESKLNENPYNYKVFAIDYDRGRLYDKINRRVNLMFENGLIQEVKNLVNKYTEFPTSMQGLGYKEVRDYLKNKITKEEMIEKIKQNSRRYAKRQFTWFRKNKETIWLNGEKNIEDNVNIIMEELSERKK